MLSPGARAITPVWKDHRVARRMVAQLELCRSRFESGERAHYVANLLAVLGLGACDVVMPGSVVPVIDVTVGDTFEIGLGPPGTLEVSFVDGSHDGANA